jgi:hypothetical protein
VGGALDGNDPFRCGGEGIVPEMHWRGACVIGAAQKFELHASLSRDGIHGSKRATKRVEDRPLLDVKFEIGEGLVTQHGTRNLCWIQSKVSDGGANGNSMRILAVEKLLIEPADQGAAADEGYAETDAFLFGKTDDLDCEGKPATSERFEESDCYDNAENAVVGSRIGDRIEV